jgi:phage gp46-like protein
MFDLATAPQQSSGLALLAGVPFDLRLVQPLAAGDYAWNDFASPSGAAVPGVDVLETFALALEDSLQTAIIQSLFTDARALDDDALPAGTRDRRGWLGEEYASGGLDAAQDIWGSRLWLLYQGKATGDVLERARFEAEQALAWMLRDGVASRIEVSTQWVGERLDRLAIRPRIYQGDAASPSYDVLWGATITRLTPGLAQ